MQPETENEEEVAWSQIENRLLAILHGMPTQKKDWKITEQLGTHRTIRRKWSYAQELLSALSYCKSCCPVTPGLDRILDPLKFCTERNWRQQLLSAWILRNAPLTAQEGERAVEAMGAMLRWHNSNRHLVTGANFVRALARTAVSISSCLCVLCLFIVPLSTDGVFPRLIDLLTGLFGCIVAGCVLSVFAVFFVMPFSVAVDRNRMLGVMSELALGLGVSPHPQSVSVLVETALINKPVVTGPALASLVNVLPTITSEHYGQLDSQTVPNLCRLLEIRSQEQTDSYTIELLILQTLEHIGDARAMKTVTKLKRYALNKAVRVKAEAVLTVLIERERAETEAKTLLRGSAPSVYGPIELLRPASAAFTERETLQLVRPSQADEG